MQLGRPGVAGDSFAGFPGFLAQLPECSVGQISAQPGFGVIARGRDTDIQRLTECLSGSRKSPRLQQQNPLDMVEIGIIREKRAAPDTGFQRTRLVTGHDPAADFIFVQQMSEAGVRLCLIQRKPDMLQRLSVITKPHILDCRVELVKSIPRVQLQLLFQQAEIAADFILFGHNPVGIAVMVHGYRTQVHGCRRCSLDNCRSNLLVDDAAEPVLRTVAEHPENRIDRNDR
ncbi:hypothetical protein D3C80_1289160 [compost metagenome]